MKPNHFIFALILVGLGVLIGKSLTENRTHTDINQESTKETIDSSDLQDPKINRRPVAQLNHIYSAEELTIDLFEKAAPSVVYITTSNVRKNYWNRDVTEIPSGSGSGFIWDK